jgi:5-methylcytosine-specific restriction endonuclease McrA
VPRAQKHCGYNGCMVLVQGGKRCPEHQYRFRGDPRTSTPEHRKWRAAVLKRDGYRCQLQLPGRCIGRATEADHIVPVSAGGDPLALWNGRAACVACHRKHSSDQGHLAQGHTPRTLN